MTHHDSLLVRHHLRVSLLYSFTGLASGFAMLVALYQGALEPFIVLLGLTLYCNVHSRASLDRARGLLP